MPKMDHWLTQKGTSNQNDEAANYGGLQRINIQIAYRTLATGTMMPIAIAATRKTRSPIS